MPTKMSGIAQLAPVESTSLHSQVFAQLRQAIIMGKFRPGEVLTLRALAAALGTSIMPARDAVLRLISDRALEQSGRRVRVPILNRQQVEDIWRFRVALEGEAASLAAQRATEEEIEGIRQAAIATEKARQTGRVDRFVAANQEFHFAVYRAAHSDLLQSMIETLWLQIGPYLGQLIQQMPTGQLVEGADFNSHDLLVEALVRRDADAARAALAADLQDSVDIYQPLAEPTEEDTRRAAG